MFTGMYHEPKGEICPRCENEKLYSIKTRNAISRIDQETYICSKCAREEALINAGLENSEESLLKELDFKLR